jgi:type VI secretion system protein ImpL
LYEHFGIRFPVYMIFTKCDLVAGFMEFFDDLDHDGRQQVWGTTFQLQDKPKDGDDDISAFRGQLDLLLERLNDRMTWRMSQERDQSRRSKIYTFPQQLTALSATLDSFLTDVFSNSRFDDTVLVRGVYFTSGIQEGAPIDRMMSVMAKTFGVAEQALPSFGGKGRSYFITDLLRKIVFQESGLAGVNRRIEKRRRFLQTGAYSAAIVLAVVATFAWITSFTANRGYVEEVSEELNLYTQLPAPVQGRSQTLEEVLPRLDALRNVLDVAQQHQDAVPMHMRMWLYQGDTMSERVGDAYRRELNESLGPVVMSILETRIRENTGSPQLLYEYLKAYMMLGNPERMEPRQLAFLISAEWKRTFADEGEKYSRLKKHSDFLFEHVIPYAVNERLISGAQATLAQAPLSDFLYSRLKLDALGYQQDDLILSAQLGLGFEKVYQRKSGVPLSEPISVLYTKKGFTELYPTLAATLIAEAGKENWVLGREEAGLSVSEIANIESELRAKYTADYIATWQTLLGDLEIVPLAGEAQAMETLDLIAAKPSVMHELLLIVATNTNLSTPKPAEDEAGEEEGTSSRLGRMFGDQDGAAQFIPANPGDPITLEFARLNRLVTGQPAAIEPLLLLVDNLQREAEETSAGGDVLSVIARGGGPAARRIRTESRRQPEPLKSWLTALGGGSQALAAGSAKAEMSSTFSNTVAVACKRLISGRYPFDRNSQQDVAVDDFGSVFGHKGVFDNYFEENLAPVVDRSGSTWKIRSDSPLRISAVVLRQFQLAERIRETYFRSGGQKPDVTFTVTPTGLDPEVKRFVFEANDQSFSYQHGPQRPTTINWPGSGTGDTRVMFEEASGGRPTVVEEGPWGLFRLLDSSNIRPLSDIKYEAVVTAGSRSATLAIETRSVTNPFSGLKLHEFRCPDNL